LLGADATGTAGDLGTTIPAVHRARIWAQLALSGVFLFILFGSRVAFYVVACAINYVLTMPRAKGPTANGIVSRGSSPPTSGWLPGTYPLPQYFLFLRFIIIYSIDAFYNSPLPPPHFIAPASPVGCCPQDS
jgi:hypothetical protein